ncbi:MAG: asparagine synthase (glutamine-hydrolyzing) [Eubacteriales bacterium]
MCSISGIYGSDVTPIARMNGVMTHRGPDDCGIAVLSPTAALGHNRLAVMDPLGGVQPMTRTLSGKTATIVYNGEIYNAPELRNELSDAGATFTTSCDTEAVLYAYLHWGEDCPSHLNGIFAFLIYDHQSRELLAVRDRLGVKPLYYARLSDGGWLFASEIKGILAHGGIPAVVDRQGLWQLLFLTPTTLPGTTVYKGISQLEPGKRMKIGPNGVKTDRYWSLRAEKCTDSPAEAAEKVRAILSDAVRRQICSDVPLCTFLSGGLDSSVITALAVEDLKKEGKVLSTYSFEYAHNRENFHTSLFQPGSDDDFAPELAKWLGTDHTVLTATDEDVAGLLEDAAYYRDLPGQADIDSSLLYYCRQVKKRHTVALSGECSDEIFGGYPWFYRPEMLSRGFFPWIHDPFVRAKLIRPEVAGAEEGYAWLSDCYHKVIDRTPLADSDDGDMIVSRRATVLSTEFFMANLLERKDRMSMAASLEVRVPFADHRIIEYVYNLPWDIKFAGGVEKALLRNAMGDLLPEKVLWRKKSPYPKTHSPGYEHLVQSMLSERMKKDCLFCELVDRQAVRNLLDGSGGGTWFGQLMGRPQLMGWLVQLAAFLDHCRVEL